MAGVLSCLVLVFVWGERAGAAGGGLDTSFDPGTGADSHVMAIELQPDGKILIGGHFTTYNGVARSAIARINPDGSLDPTFNPGFHPESNSDVSAIKLQPDGKIIVGGSFLAYSTTRYDDLARLNPDGSIDTTFNPGSGPVGGVQAIELQPDGKILIAGNFAYYDGENRRAVARINPDGSLDTSFNQEGGLAPNGVNEILLQPDGKVIVAGYFEVYYTADSTVSRNGIARLNADGTLDTTFDPGTGARNTSTVSNNAVSAAALLPDGKIIIAGELVTYNDIPRKGVARINADGSLDTSFDPGTSLGDFVSANSLAVQPDGKIILGGDFYDYSNTHRHLKRLNADGSLDTTFNTGTGPNSLVYAMALQPDGKILIGGIFTVYNGTAINRIARVLSGLDTVAFSSATYSVKEGAGNATISLKRAGGGSGAISVKYATSDGTATGGRACGGGRDYLPRTGTLSWADGDMANKTFTIPVCDDAVFEGGEKINLALSNVTGSGAFGSPQAAVLTILDDEAQPKVSVNSVTVTEGDSLSTKAVFTVKLSVASSKVVTVDYRTANISAAAPADYAALPPTTLTFSPGQTSKAVTAVVKGDLIDEVDETFKLVLSSPTNAAILTWAGVCTITDNDTANISITNATVTEPDAGTINMTFTVNLSLASSRQVTVKYQTADGTAAAPADYTARALTTLIFSPGQKTRAVTVQIKGEQIVEPSETFFVNLSAPVNAAIADAQGLGTIINDD